MPEARQRSRSFKAAAVLYAKPPWSSQTSADRCNSAARGDTPQVLESCSTIAETLLRRVPGPSASGRADDTPRRGVAPGAAKSSPARPADSGRPGRDARYRARARTIRTVASAPGRAADLRRSGTREERMQGSQASTYHLRRMALDQLEPSIPARYYYDPQHYERELEVFWYGRWVRAGREAELREP